MADLMGLHKFIESSSSNRKYAKYEAAVTALNGLQSNSALIAERQKKPIMRMESMKKFLIRTGVRLEKLDTLSVIHVTGTKGKGSTCALCECALRTNGVKTGLFSSPHILEVRERIRLSGIPIERKTFAKYFWKIYNKLNEEKESATDMPPYFQFLTIMAFHVFLEERVDVAIMEVGIGGAFDCTNILRKTDVVGITSIGFDHMSILGDKLTDIAWQKAGIIKPGCHAFTSSNQQPEALVTLRKVAREHNVTLLEAPPLSHYTGIDSWLEHFSPVTRLNASLALQLAWAWQNIYKKNSIEIDNKFGIGFAVPREISQAFVHCVLPGRAQHISLNDDLTEGKIDLFLDGAHTPESAELCVKWFCEHFISSESRNILIFNSTGGRDSTSLLKPISSACKFYEAIFCPNLASKSAYGTVDQVKIENTDELIQNCHQNAFIWDSLKENKCPSIVLGSVKEAISRIKSYNKDMDTKVLITGSLHLVGAVLAVLEMDGTFQQEISQRQTIQ